MQKFLLVLACLAQHAQSVAITPPGSGGAFATKGAAAVVQGKSLKTWSYRSSVVDHVQVVLSTDGRPLDADVQLWQGPDNTPCKMRVYSEDGNIRPFSAVIATPDDGESTVAVRNVGESVFPLAAYVSASEVDEPVADFRDTSMIVQGGGALRTYEFNTPVESVEVTLKTDGRPLNARIELLEGPNNIKQVIELYTEDGLERPFFAIIDTKGMGNVVRVVNTAPLEFPMFASVEPHYISGKMKLVDHVAEGQKHVTGFNSAKSSRHLEGTMSTRSRGRHQGSSPVSAAMKGSARKLADLLTLFSEV